TRRQGHEIDAEVLEPARIAQSTTRTSGARGIERRWIARTLTCWNGGYVNLRHSLLTLCASTKEATYGKCVPAAVMSHAARPRKDFERKACTLGRLHLNRGAPSR